MEEVLLQIDELNVVLRPTGEYFIHASPEPISVNLVPQKLTNLQFFPED